MLARLADTVIQQLGSLAAKSIEKPIDANIFSPAEIAVYIARIGIVALKDKKEATTQKAVTALTEFEKRYIGKMLETHKNFPDHIFEGLGEIKRRLRRNEMILLRLRSAR